MEEREKKQWVLEYLNKDEQDDIIGISSQKDIYGKVILICLYTGLRLSEALNLTWNDVDLEKNILTVRRVKGGIERIIPIAEKAKTIFKEIKREQQFSKQENYKEVYLESNFIFTSKFGCKLKEGGVCNIWRKLLSECNIVYKKFHALRNTYVFNLLQDDTPIESVSKLLGHYDVTMTNKLYGNII